MSRSLATGAVALAVLMAGCGDDAGTPADRDKVRSVVTQFAEADDAHACDLLTGKALRDLYGGFRDKVPKAHRKCVEKSAEFEGEPVEITKLELVDDVTAKVSALGADKKFTYAITLRKPRKQWRIDEINQYKVR